MFIYVYLAGNEIEPYGFGRRYGRDTITKFTNNRTRGSNRRVSKWSPAPTRYDHLCPDVESETQSQSQLEARARLSIIYTRIHGAKE